MKYKRRGIDSRQGRDGAYRRSTHGTNPFYGTKAWKDLRKQVIERDNNTCCECGDYIGRGGAHVDHIVSMAKAPDRALDIRNLQTLCHQCHSSKTARLDCGFGSGQWENKKQGCDESGIPLDPGHHWNRKPEKF